MDSPSLQAPPTPRPRRRWLKIGLGVVVLLAILTMFAPRLVAAIARPRIEAALEDSLDVDASLEELDLGWSGRAQARGLTLKDHDGRVVLHAEEIHSQIALLAALRGSIRADAQARGVEIDLQRDKQGHWNVEDILRAGERKPGERKPSSEPRELPDVELELELEDCLVRVHDAAAGEYVLGPIASSFTLDAIESPAKVRFHAPIRTPEGDEGMLDLDASVAFVRDRRIDLEALAGVAKVDLEGMPLAAVGALGFLPAAIEKLAGSGGGTLRCTLDPTHSERPIALEGKLAVADLDLAFAPSEAGKDPFVLHEEHVGLSFDLGLDARALDLGMERIHLESAAISGDVRGKLEHLRALLADAPKAAEPARVTGVQAHFTYVPDRIGALLARWIPGKLSGSEEQPLSFTVDGPLVRGDLQTKLEALAVRADVRLGAFETAGIRTKGDLGITSESGRAAIDGRFELNGGSVRMDGDLGLAASASGPSKLFVRVDGAQARGQLTPLLAWLHPIFAGLSAAKTGALEGTITADLELAWPGPLPLAELQLGAQGIDWKQLSGRGSFALAKAGVNGSAFLDQLLDLLGKTGETQLSLQPLAFHIDAGRLAYDKPWSWTLGGMKTTFGGSVGFDKSLALAWSVPLGEAFLKKQGLPKELAGETLTLPLAGTLDHPKLDWKSALDDLTKDAWTKEFTERVDDAKKDLEKKLGEELGGKLEDALGGKSKDDPAELLKRADELWSAGKKDEARPLYVRLRAEFELTPTYLLNRDRIKERAKE